MPASSGGFDQFGFAQALTRRLAESGHPQPSHLQQVCIPPLLAGRDLFAEAPAGTGRTLAFVLPLLQTLNLADRQPQVLVLTPNDRMSLHVAEVFQSYARYLPEFHVLPINHQSAAIQSRQMRRGTQVVVGTPRRILHHRDDHGLEIGGVARVVLDEADEMLREGFGDDIRRVLACLPATRQSAIFTSVPSRELRRLASDIQRQAVAVKGVERTIAPGEVRQRYWQIGNQSKLNALARLIEVEPDFDAALVFVHDAAGAILLAEKLNARGYASIALDGEGPPDAGVLACERVERGDVDLVISTDHAARHVRLRRITHVVSYDMPCDATSYADRIAHVSRTGHRTTAVLFVTPSEVTMLHGLERAIRQSIAELELPERIR